jgi:hypothetical protein
MLPLQLASLGQLTAKRSGKLITINHLWLGNLDGWWWMANIFGG